MAEIKVNCTRICICEAKFITDVCSSRLTTSDCNFYHNLDLWLFLFSFSLEGSMGGLGGGGVGGALGGGKNLTLDRSLLLL